MTIWQHRAGSTLDQVMTWCHQAPSHYLNQYWLIIIDVLWHSPESYFTGTAHESVNMHSNTHFPAATEWIQIYPHLPLFEMDIVISQCIHTSDRLSICLSIQQCGFCPWKIFIQCLRLGGVVLSIMMQINMYKLEHWERLHSENTPCHPMITHTIDSYWIHNQNMTKSKLQI